jgi:large subunit ribosomal protein L5
MADDKKKASKGDKAPKAPKADKGGTEPKKARTKGDGGSAAGPRTQGRPASLVGKQRLRVHYEDKVRPALMERFGYTSVMQAPRLEKIVVNMGVGDAITDQKLMDAAVNELSQISGQRPSVRKAKKSIANFKLREGNEIGAKVTLRGDRMWEFYDRLVSLAIPRIRDFRGMSPKQFDGSGNYTFGLTEQLVFPEIDYDRIDSVRGMDITIVTTAVTDDQGRALLRALGFPFRRDGQG